MPTQKDIEEFIEIWKQSFGEVLTPGEAQIKLDQLIYLITDMAKMPPAPEEETEPLKTDPPPGFMGFWPG